MPLRGGGSLLPWPVRAGEGTERKQTWSSCSPAPCPPPTATPHFALPAPEEGEDTQALPHPPRGAPLRLGSSERERGFSPFPLGSLGFQLPLNLPPRSEKPRGGERRGSTQLVCEMKTMCGDGGIRVQPPRGGGWRRPPRGRRLGAAAASASARRWGRGAAARNSEEAGAASWRAAGRGVRGQPRRGGRGAGTQPRLPGPQLRPRAQEQIVLGGGGGGSGGSGPPRSQLRINKGRRRASGGGAPPSVRWLLWNNKK